MEERPESFTSNAPLARRNVNNACREKFNFEGQCNTIGWCHWATCGMQDKQGPSCTQPLVQPPRHHTVSCMHVHRGLRRHTLAHKHTYTYIHTRKHIFTRKHLFTHANIYIHTHIQLKIYEHIYRHTCTNTRYTILIHMRTQR